jgi:rSAM/selenodomain-associated transferase 1
VALVPFIKAPRVGAVKTRLCPPLSPAQACALHRAFAEDLLRLCGAVKQADVILSSDDPRHPFIVELARRHGVPIRAQRGRDLGQRMAEAVEALSRGRDGVVLVGADCPRLPAAYLREAVRRVPKGVVIGPAEDGGYVCIGLPRPAPHLFRGIAWGGPRVLAETLARASSRGESPHLLPGLYDVDTAADLTRLRADLARLSPGVAPATRAALVAIDASAPAPSAPRRPGPPTGRFAPPGSEIDGPGRGGIPSGPQMRVRALGCHGGESPRHRSTCFLVDGTVALDAGSLTSGLDLAGQRRLEHIVVSHSHLDHVKDLAGLADNVVGFIKRPIELWATRHTTEVLLRNYFNNAIWPDFTRIPTQEQPVYRFRELVPNGEVEVGAYRVRAIPVHHPVESMGLIVHKKGRRGALAFSSDTGPTDKFWEAIHADGTVKALLLELSFPNRLQNLADIAGHFTPRTMAAELSKLRAEIPVYLYHMKPPHLQAIEKEIRALKNRRLHLLKLDQQFRV